MEMKFKNVVSGPAPIGRILNYIYECGSKNLFHKNGHRSIKFFRRIGCAWTTEFMVGLGLITIDSKTKNTDNIYTVKLTNNGNKIYNLINKDFKNYSESTHFSDLSNIKKKILKTNNFLYEVFKNIFLDSQVFSYLKAFLKQYGVNNINKKDFINNYFLYVAKCFKKNNIEYNPEARTTTAENRVISTLQLCIFFDLLTIENEYLYFSLDQTYNHTLDIKEFDDTILNIENKLKTVDLNKYGIDGTTLITAIVRNSYLQYIFKSNLMSIFDNKCCICGALFNLIGSHIKPATSCSADEKVDDNNGLLLCPNHDALFDKYYISFHHKNGNIMICKDLLNNKEQLKILNLKQDINLLKFINKERALYLKYHNSIFNQKNNL